MELLCGSGRRVLIIYLPSTKGFTLIFNHQFSNIPNTLLCSKLWVRSEQGGCEPGGPPANCVSLWKAPPLLVSAPGEYATMERCPLGRMCCISPGISWKGELNKKVEKNHASFPQALYTHLHRLRSQVCKDAGSSSKWRSCIGPHPFLVGCFSWAATSSPPPALSCPANPWASE